MAESGGKRPQNESETIMSLSDSGRSISAEDELPAGTKIGKYTVKRLLGRGGMGAVYEARDTFLQRDVALKLLPRTLTSEPTSLKRFIREAQLAARMNHVNAVHVYDVGRKGETYYIAMELVRGENCDQALRRGRRFSASEATAIAADACRAIGAAHKAGLIHRDVKPANILLADDGAVKVADFGLAKLHAHAPNDLTLTQKDLVLGTPKYMSPEQCQNEQVDGRTDIYALGATYYALLTGAAPYDEGSTMQILFAHCTKPVPDPRERVADLPEGCAAIVQRAMAKKPGERYATAEAMLADLETVRRGDDTTVTMVRPAGEGFGGMLAVLEQTRPVDTLLHGMPTVQLAPRRKTGSPAPMLALAGIAAGVLLLIGLVVWAMSHRRDVGVTEDTPAIAAAPLSSPTPTPAMPAPTVAQPAPAPIPVPAPPAPVAEAPIAAAVEPPVATPVEEEPAPSDEVAAAEVDPLAPEPVMAAAELSALNKRLQELAPVDPASPDAAFVDDTIYRRVRVLEAAATKASESGQLRTLGTTVHQLITIDQRFSRSNDAAKRAAAARAKKVAETYKAQLPGPPDGQSHPPPGQRPPPPGGQGRPPKPR